MRKFSISWSYLLLFVYVLLFRFPSYSQEIYGIGYNNYIGVNGITSNPASIAGSRYKFHFNLATISAYGGSNLYEINSNAFYRFKHGNWKENTEYRKLLINVPKNAWINTDVLGPSFLLNWNKSTAIGISTRLRSMASGYNFSNGSFSLFDDPTPDIYNKSFNEKNVNINAHGFADIGFTYAKVIKKEQKRFWKAGITLKYIQGISAARVSVDNLNINLRDQDAINNLNGKGSLLYAQNIDRWTDEGNKFDSRNDISIQNGSAGFDIGTVYEIRNGRFQPNPDRFKSSFRTIPYSFRLSLALTDIGMPVKYRTGSQSADYNITADNIMKAAINKRDEENIEEFLKRLQVNDLIKKTGASKYFKMPLPSSIRANADWQVAKLFFINADAHISLRNAKKSNSPSYISIFSLIPRFESQWFGLSLPLSVDVRNQFNWGAGIRMGPVIIGSHSLFSNLLKTDFNNIDGYAGFSIPVYQGERRKKEKKQKPSSFVEVSDPPAPSTKPVVIDKDGDGIPDAEDTCPDKAGPEKLKGCPDTDSDGIADPSDTCPTVFGVERYDGCPVPDTDNDGVNNEEDKCPLLAGIPENEGCPEIKSAIIQKAEQTAKRLFFISGKATISPNSFPALHELANLLLEDTSLMLEIEGHTDNTGSDESNLRLSEKRASAAKEYLIKKGIASDRITTIGYGETKPMVPNDSKEGRSQNRRIVLKLRNH